MPKLQTFLSQEGKERLILASGTAGAWLFFMAPVSLKARNISSFRVSYFLHDKLKLHHETHGSMQNPGEAISILDIFVGFFCIWKFIYMTKYTHGPFDISIWGLKFIHWPRVWNETVLPISILEQGAASFYYSIHLSFYLKCKDVDDKLSYTI